MNRIISFWIVLLSGCIHHPTASSEALFISVVGEGSYHSQCMAFTPFNGGVVKWVVDGTLFTVTLRRVEQHWGGEIEWTDGVQIHKLPLTAFDTETGVGIGLSLPTTNQNILISVAPTSQPQFAIAACMGRPDLLPNK